MNKFDPSDYLLRRRVGASEPTKAQVPAAPSMPPNTDGAHTLTVRLSTSGQSDQGWVAASAPRARNGPVAAAAGICHQRRRNKHPPRRSDVCLRTCSRSPSTAISSPLHSAPPKHPSTVCEFISRHTRPHRKESSQ